MLTTNSLTCLRNGKRDSWFRNMIQRDQEKMTCQRVPENSEVYINVSTVSGSPVAFTDVGLIRQPPCTVKLHALGMDKSEPTS
jgi:hypothetical protein